MVCVLEDEDLAFCIVRDHSGLSADSKITLHVSGKTSVQQFVREVASRFNYEPDSFELLLQSRYVVDVILNENCTETLEACGITTGLSSRNAFLLCGIPNNLNPKLKTSPATTDEELSLGASASPTATSGAPPPPPPLLSTSTDYPYTAALIKQDTGYVGLVNQAMTCYLNSLLQALYMTPEFRNALYKWKFDQSAQNSDKSIPFQLQKLFLNLQTSCKNAVETTELTRSFGWDSSEAWQQHDIQELCRVMFDALEQVFKDTEQFDLIDKLYQGKMIDYVKCLECGREKSREDTFLDIPLPVRPFGSSVAYSSVEEALRAFVQPETLEGNNQYHCENCAKKCDAHKGLKFSKFPYLLTLHLKRFDFDYNTMHRIKLNDKVVFPEILDLNSFIVQEKDEGSEGFPEELAAGKCDDSSTTDSGSALDDESCQGSSDAPQSIDAAQDDDEGIDVSGGNGNNHHENEKNRRHTLQKGPFMYELFSIMIHSGSASGGHYYAYIKDFTNGEWFCFNDQSVSRITNDDIAKTYGGGALRGYYSGAYSSSTNAYMLMYRQIDKERNCEALSVEQFPPHIQELHQKLQEGEETDRKFKEKQSDMCKIKLYCNHPKLNTITESKMYCANDMPLKQATEFAYKNLKMEGIVPLEDCRLVNYNRIQETIEVSFEGRDDDPIGEVFSNLRTMHKHDFLLEIKPSDGEFEVYQPGGMVSKVYLVDISNEDADIQQSIVRGNLSQTVSSLKETIGNSLNLEPTSITIVLEKYSNELHLIENNNYTLKQAGFHPSNKIFVCSGPYDPDPEKPFITSKLHKIIDRFEHLITLQFVLPDTELETLSRLSIPLLSATQGATNLAKQQNNDSTVDKVNIGDLAAVTGSKGLVLPLLLASGSGDEEGGEIVANSVGGGHSDQSASEDSSLTDSDRTLIGDVPDECPSDVDYQLASPMEEAASSLPSYSKISGDEYPEENWDDDEPVNQPQQGCQIYFKASPYTENGQKMLKVVLDKRTILGKVMTALEPHVGVSAKYFKIYKMYSGQQEYECSRLRENMGTYKNDERLNIKLGRDLRNGEYNIKVYQFLPDSVQPFKFLFDWIIATNVTVGNTKKEIVEEMNRKFNVKIPLDRCRLRKKNWKNPVKVLLDSQKWVEDIPVTMTYDIALQELSEPEVVTSSNQLLLFAKRWHPSTMTLSPFEEVLLDGLTVAELKQKLSERSGIPIENVEFAKGSGSFPCALSVLCMQTNLEWNVNAETLDGWHPHISEDGHVIYYRDSKEELKILTTEDLNELNKKEAARLNSPSSTVSTYLPRRERPLKIYLDQTPRRPKVTIEPDID